jgi:preprotein translocase subunit SecF
MIQIFKPGTNYDFIGKAPLFIRISIATFVIGCIVLAIKGFNFGLDFTGGHEILLEFSEANKTTSQKVREELGKLHLGDTSVQSYEEKNQPNKQFFLVRVQRSETFGKDQIAALENAFKDKYKEALKRIRYNPEAGDVIEVEFTRTATMTGADTSSVALADLVEQTGHPVRTVRFTGRPDEHRYSVVLKGVDVSILKEMQQTIDPNARVARVEFVGPTAGKQLRNDGILAVAYALLAILIYVAARFDFFFSPGAVICLFHDSIITVALLSLLGQEFSLTTIAALMTLVGYSSNDTIIVFDRIRETVGKAQGSALRDIVNRATNETLSRTIMTSVTVLLSCVALMIFGRGTVLSQFGLIMFVGVIFGTYSSVYVAAPIFIYLRERFGPRAQKPIPVDEAKRKGKKGGPSEATA